MSWPTVALGEICRRKQWKTLSKKDLLPDGHAVYGANGPIGFTDSYTHDHDTVLVGCRGSCGALHLMPGRSYANGNAMALGELRYDLVDLKYFFRVLEARGFDDVITGTSQPQIIRSNIERIEIPLPPLEEQKRIAGILDQADRLRRLRKAALTRLNTLGQSIFHEMFGGAANSPNTTLSELIREGDKINYGVVQPGDEVEGGVRLLRAGDILSPDLDPGNFRTIAATVDQKHRKSRLVGDEVLIACVGSIGAAALAHEGLKGVNIARAVARVPLDPHRANRVFIAEQIKTERVQQYFTREIRLVAQPTLNIKQISETPIFLPPIAEQERYATLAEEVRGRVFYQADSTRKLETLFTSLQHRAFRGEL